MGLRRTHRPPYKVTVGGVDFSTHLATLEGPGGARDHYLSAMFSSRSPGPVYVYDGSGKDITRLVADEDNKR